MNKISVQFMDIGDPNEMIQVIQQLNPAVVKFCFTDSAAILEVLRRVPHIKGVVRFWWEKPHTGNSNQFHVLADYIRSRGAFNAHEAVQEWVKVVEGGLTPLLYADTSLKERLWVEGYNETNDRPEMGSRAYFEFENERCRFLGAYGLHAACISSGVGWDLDFATAKQVGLLDTMQAGGHWLSTHGYGDKLMNTKHGFMTPIDSHGTLEHPWAYYRQHRRVEPANMLNTWLAFRCGREQDALIRMGYNIIQVITETGLDAAAEDLTKTGDSGAIKSAEPFLRQHGLLKEGVSLARYYAEELLYAELQYRVYPNVIGACIFSYGGALWPSFNIRDMGVVPILAELLTQNPPGDTVPPPQVPSVIMAELAEKTPDGADLAGLNIRTKPYREVSEVILVMRRGMSFEAQGYALVEGVKWYRLKLNEQQYGWAHGGYLKILLPPDRLPAEIPAPPREDTPLLQVYRTALEQIMSTGQQALEQS